jgi:hypothetical protein
MTPSGYLQCASRFGSFIPSTSGAPLPLLFSNLPFRFPRRCTPRGVGSVATTGVVLSDFGSVAMIGLTGEFSNVWQGKDLGNGEGWKVGRAPSPHGFLNDMIPKGLERGSVNDRIPWELGGRGQEIPRPGSGQVGFRLGKKLANRRRPVSTLRDSEQVYTKQDSIK